VNDAPGPIRVRSDLTVHGPGERKMLAPAECPMGYTTQEGHLEEGHASSQKSLIACGRLCNATFDCLEFEYNPGDGWCVQNGRRRPATGALQGSRYCTKQLPEAPLFAPPEYVQQPGASIAAEGDVRLYVVGSSNVLWMTWIDQFHLYLKRLGYKVPTVPTKTKAQVYASSLQRCDDSLYFEHLRTSRFGMIGWHSWDFAYDDWSDCDYGYRDIAGHKVKCEHGPGCNFGKFITKASDIAEDASRSDIVLVTTWYNDDQSDVQTCLKGRLNRMAMAKISIASLLRTARSIHATSPSTWVVVMGKYGNFHAKYDFMSYRINAVVKKAVEREPRTLFVDYRRPASGGWRPFEMYQRDGAHKFHLNCRGSNLMAQAILERLFAAKVLSRSIRLVSPAVNMNERNCKFLDGDAACRTSGFCWVDPSDKRCKEYGPGSKDVYEHADRAAPKVPSLDLV